MPGRLFLDGWLICNTIGKTRIVLHSNTFRHFSLIKKTEVTYNVSIYRFGLPRPNDIIGLPVGQHISIGATPKGCDKEIVRSYTPISSNEERGYVDLMIKTYPQGNISAYMATLKVGDRVKLRGPKGAMTYTANMCDHIGMIAGGTGITPMLQIIREIHKGRPKRGGKDVTKVDLIFANVNEEDILLKDELDRLAAEDPDFSVYYVLNNPPKTWHGGVGFVNAEMIQKCLPAPGPGVRILLCGPPPMVGALKKATESLGFGSSRAVSKATDQVFCF